MNYSDFLDSKRGCDVWHGFDARTMPTQLFDFQSHLVEWALRKGRSGIFADCGLGKTAMELSWADAIHKRTNRPVLILTPLAVAGQFVREGEKFGIECKRVKEGASHPGINITNYEQLHYYDPHDYEAVVGDESGCIKDFMSRRRKDVTEFFKRVRYRLLATATPAPNDFIELGTSSEAIGDLGHMDMLARFFKNEDKTIFLHGTKYGDMTQKNWRFKPHAEEPFWRWICSWARACRRPSDLGFDDSRFILPELAISQHDVAPSRMADGFLFDIGAKTLAEQREVERRTITERCEKAADLAAREAGASVIWCHLNAEADLCERIIPGAIQVSGSDSDDAKEEKFAAFQSGQALKMVTKPKVAAWGLNWQHCSHQTFFPSNSFEQWYQCVRRSWRFGQTERVRIEIVTSDGATDVLANLNRKAAAAEKMFARLVEFMHRFQSIGRSRYGDLEPQVPAWLNLAAQQGEYECPSLTNV